MEEVNMTILIFIAIVLPVELWLSVQMIINVKNNYAIVGELFFSVVLAEGLTKAHLPLKQVLVAVILEYLLVKVLLIIFMIVTRKYSFYVIKRLATEKRKRKNTAFTKRYSDTRRLKRIKKFYQAQYWPRLKLGLPGMANQTHGVTKVKFDDEGFPRFKSYYKVKLQRKDFKKKREQHFYICNKKLYRAVISSATLKANLKLSSKDIKRLEQGETPSKYVWHHHQDAGVLQLVERSIHEKTYHVGGYSIWGSKG